MFFFISFLQLVYVCKQILNIIQCSTASEHMYLLCVLACSQYVLSVLHNHLFLSWVRSSVWAVTGHGVGTARRGAGAARAALSPAAPTIPPCLICLWNPLSDPPFQGKYSQLGHSPSWQPVKRNQVLCLPSCQERVLTSWSLLYPPGNTSDGAWKMHLTSGKALSAPVGFGECSSLHREALRKVCA